MLFLTWSVAKTPGYLLYIGGWNPTQLYYLYIRIPEPETIRISWWQCHVSGFNVKIALGNTNQGFPPAPLGHNSVSTRTRPGDGRFQVFPKIGVPNHPKWRVYKFIIENPMNKWMIWGVFPYFWFNIQVKNGQDSIQVPCVYHPVRWSSSGGSRVRRRSRGRILQKLGVFTIIFVCLKYIRLYNIFDLFNRVNVTSNVWGSSSVTVLRCV